MIAEVNRRLPLTIVTGFLGSGKTTLIRSLLADPAFANAAVIVNEFGEIGIDHHLFFPTEERITLLHGGCACCARREDLVEALHDLISRFDREEAAPFNRVILETTGLADPAPILHTILADPLLTRRIRLDRTITTVDAIAGWNNLDRYPEAVRQVTAADLVLVTKGGLADIDQVERLLTRLRILNPSACVERFTPETSGSLGSFQEISLTTSPLRELRTASEDVPLHGPGGVATLCLESDIPLDWPMLGLWLTMLLHCHGERVLRVKGLLNIDAAGPLLLEGVQHVVHAPRHLRHWPDDDRRSRIVFILRDLDPEVICTSFQTYQDLARTL